MSTNYNINNLIIAQPKTGERAIKIGDTIFVGLDSESPSTYGAQLAQLTTCIPPVPAYSAPSSYVVTGFGTTMGEEDLSEWNGTYIVTPETSGEVNFLNRIFKKANENKYLLIYHDTDWDANMAAFTSTPTPEYVYQCRAYKYNINGYPPSGTSYWPIDEGIGEEMELTLTQSNADYPYTPPQLSGYMISGAVTNNGLRTYKIDPTLVEFTNYDRLPSGGGIFTVPSAGYLGNKLGDSLASPQKELVYALSQAQPANYCGDKITSRNGNYSIVTDELGNKVIELFGADGNTAPYFSLDTEDFDIYTTVFFGDFTFAARVKLLTSNRTALVAGDQDCDVGIDNIGGKWTMWYGSDRFNWDILQGDDTSAESSGQGTINSIPNTWQTVVWTRSGNLWTLYVDGNVSISKTRQAPTTKVDTTNSILINRWGANAYNENMQIGAVRIYDYGMTAAQVASLLTEKEFGGNGN